MEAALARSVLTYAFAREIVDTLPEPALRETVGRRVAEWLPGGAAARELA
jgi:hypothetical protein